MEESRRSCRWFHSTHLIFLSCISLLSSFFLLLRAVFFCFAVHWPSKTTARDGRVDQKAARATAKVKELIFFFRGFKLSFLLFSRTSCSLRLRASLFYYDVEHGKTKKTTREEKFAQKNVHQIKLSISPEQSAVHEQSQDVRRRQEWESSKIVQTSTTSLAWWRFQLFFHPSIVRRLHLREGHIICDNSMVCSLRCSPWVGNMCVRRSIFRVV